VYIRAFELSDESAVIALWERCGLVRAWNDPLKDIQRKLSDSPELFLVAQEGQAVVGSAMAGYDGHRGAVNYLAVDPAAQQRGLGRSLMTEVERLLRQRGCPKLNILIRNSNLGVRDFYSALGYELENVVCMGKRLIPDV